MKSIIVTLLICFSMPLLALSQEMTDMKDRTQHYNLEDGNLAIEGYDPVSYFVSDEPQEGSEDITYTYEGVTYRFVNKENLAKFEANPEKYEPAYGGWCAYAMGKDGSKVEVDPETYKIIDGKLNLYYHTLFVNTLKKWNKDEKALKSKADKSWSEIIDQK